MCRHDLSSVSEVWSLVVGSDLVFSKGRAHFSLSASLYQSISLLFVDRPNSRSFFMILSFLTARMLGRLPLSNSLNVFFSRRVLQHFFFRSRVRVFVCHSLSRHFVVESLIWQKMMK